MAGGYMTCGITMAINTFDALRIDVSRNTVERIAGLYDGGLEGDAIRLARQAGIV